jgi:hypothetical protein
MVQNARSMCVRCCMLLYLLYLLYCCIAAPCALHARCHVGTKCGPNRATCNGPCNGHACTGSSSVGCKLKLVLNLCGADYVHAEGRSLWALAPPAL